LGRRKEGGWWRGEGGRREKGEGWGREREKGGKVVQERRRREARGREQRKGREKGGEGGREREEGVGLRRWKGGKIEEGEDKVMWQIVSESDSESTTMPRHKCHVIFKPVNTIIFCFTTSSNHTHGSRS